MPSIRAATLAFPASCFCSLFLAILTAYTLCAASAQTTMPRHLPMAERELKQALLQPDDWYASGEGARFCRNLVTWQNDNGGWWKQYDPTIPRPSQLPSPDPAGAPDDEATWRGNSTIDNGATYSEIRILARAHRVKPDASFQRTFERGIDFLLAAQLPNGGWPQRFPLPNNYGRHITFNDHAMVNVMRLLDEVASGGGDFVFVDQARRAKCRAAFDRGVQCILDCQYKRNGELTVWCQQHDETTLAPASARTYELPSLTSFESCDIVQLLMRLPNPGGRVRESIHAAVNWLEQSKITGKRWAEVNGPQYEGGRDKMLLEDPTAPPLWARFYDLQSNQPFVCDRDGVPRASVADISHERRVKYAWYGQWAGPALAQYTQWKQGARIIDVAPGATRAGCRTIQSAIDSIPAANDEACVIVIQPATYRERLHVPKTKAKLTLLGAGMDPTRTVITFDLNANSIPQGATQPVGTSGSATCVFEGADFTAENLTFENSAGDRGQAVAAKALGDRAVFRNCRFLGWQDTLYTDSGRHYFVNCYVEGRVDFIFGGATAVFDRCTIHSKNGGYVTAARTPADQPFGFVFLDCTLSGDDVPAYLGRPWQWDRGRVAAVAFVRTRMGPHIRPEGWNRWDRPDNPNTQPARTCRYSEYQSTDLAGKLLDSPARVHWSHQLSADEAARLTAHNVLAGHDLWDPTVARD